jgi:hypothetical protein
MFTRPGNWSTLSSDKRREARFASWISTADKKFTTPEAEATYRKRAQRCADIVALKKPDRVPLLPFIGGFFASYGGITPYEVMYDYDKYRQAYTKFAEDFRPDYSQFSGAFNPGRMFDALDYKTYRWPSHGLPKTENFQAVEKEYMAADEYDQLIADPEAFYMRVYLPRACGALGAFQMLPSMWATMELPMAPAFFVPVGIPEVQQAFKAFLEAGKAALDWAMALGQTEGDLLARLGMPRLPGGFTKAPFDFIGDTLRGTKGIMLDTFRQPKKVVAAVERITPIAIQLGVETATVQDNPFVFIPLHKGADGFMSHDKYQKFYWPTHKAVLMGLIEEGLVPFHLVEGGYNERLDEIAASGLPAGATYWNFDLTDMAQVKKKFGKWAAIGGNIPGSLLFTATATQVADYVKKLIDTVARDGGFALATGVVIDHAKPENMHAMFKTCKEYGVYK